MPGAVLTWRLNMATVLIRQGQRCIPVTISTPVIADDVLSQAGLTLPHPCGGRGRCGKCAIMLSGCVSEPNAHEQAAGVRLSCQAVILGDAQIVLPQRSDIAQIEAGMYRQPALGRPMPGRYGAAVDVGTTTLALALYDLTSGACLATSAMANPQISVAADVIGRIDAAMHGRLASLQTQIADAIDVLLQSACGDAGIAPVDSTSMVITGNTTMLYLLTGRDPTSLSRAPFEADCLFGGHTAFLMRRALLPRCLHAFVGADTSCAILASGMLNNVSTALLCDVGTNGELALWHNGKLYIASTAAGPAFEGAGIRHGSSAIRGTIDRAVIYDGAISVHTIGDAPATGICGSGLVDILACLLSLGTMDETGSLEDDEVKLADGVSITQRDVRAVQLAKAAIAAGITCLLKAADCPAEAVDTLYIAGGFGRHINIANAARIGLIPTALAGKVKVIGNAALNGAAMLLLDEELNHLVSSLPELAVHVRLDGNPLFSQQYVEEMLFPE